MPQQPGVWQPAPRKKLPIPLCIRGRMMEMKNMKRTFFATVALLLFASLALADEPRPEPTQNPEAPYRLFSTKNIYTLLKLDTREGRIWQVQWGEHSFTLPINEKALAVGGKPGRFSLYPTSNIYTLLLLDQETGDAWRVQWGQSENYRYIAPVD
jgi:hypothetical protein